MTVGRILDIIDWVVKFQVPLSIPARVAASSTVRLAPLVPEVFLASILNTLNPISEVGTIGGTW